ncbi:hypothetical protein MDAP_001053 [Mitosporidium daphniae]
MNPCSSLLNSGSGSGSDIYNNQYDNRKICKEAPIVVFKTTSENNDQPTFIRVEHQQLSPKKEKVCPNPFVNQPRPPHYQTMCNFGHDPLYNGVDQMHLNGLKCNHQIKGRAVVVIATEDHECILINDAEIFSSFARVVYPHHNFVEFFADNDQLSGSKDASDNSHAIGENCFPIADSISPAPEKPAVDEITSPFPPSKFPPVQTPPVKPEESIETQTASLPLVDNSRPYVPWWRFWDRGSYSVVSTVTVTQQMSTPILSNFTTIEPTLQLPQQSIVPQIKDIKGSQWVQHSDAAKTVEIEDIAINSATNIIPTAICMTPSTMELYDGQDKDENEYEDQSSIKFAEQLFGGNCEHDVSDQASVGLDSIDTISETSSSIKMVSGATNLEVVLNRMPEAEKKFLISTLINVYNSKKLADSDDVLVSSEHFAKFIFLQSGVDDASKLRSELQRGMLDILDSCDDSSSVRAWGSIKAALEQLMDVYIDIKRRK